MKPEYCSVCLHAENDHPFRHPFTVEGKSWDMSVEDKPQVRQLTGPFDPVLRQALIDKGILTPDDLVDAEKKISAVMSTMAHQPITRGDGDGN